MKDLLLWKGYTSLGEASAKVADYPGAVGAYTQALDILADDGASWHTLGYLYETLGETSAALASYEQAVGSEPFFFAAQWDLARLLVSQGRTEEARKVAQHALEWPGRPAGLEPDPFRGRFEALLRDSA